MISNLSNKNITASFVLFFGSTARVFFNIELIETKCQMNSISKTFFQRKKKLWKITILRRKFYKSKYEQNLTFSENVIIFLPCVPLLSLIQVLTSIRKHRLKLVTFASDSTGLILLSNFKSPTTHLKILYSLKEDMNNCAVYLSSKLISVSAVP